MMQVKKTLKLPQRKCVGCKKMKDKQQIVRIVISISGDIAVDITNKANGRGAYVCRDLNCLQKAKKEKGLERSFKRTVSSKVYESLAHYINSTE